MGINPTTRQQRGGSGQADGWLPNWVGFPTPTAQDIITAQMNPETTPQMISFRWAMLLIGSLLMCGIVPRLLTWLCCLMMVRSSRMTWYQTAVLSKLSILAAQRWLTRWQPCWAKPIAPTAQISLANKLAVLLECRKPTRNGMPKPSVWRHKTLVISMIVMTWKSWLPTFKATLFRVLVGISNLAPDRGTLRKLDNIASAAKAAWLCNCSMPIKATCQVRASETIKTRQLAMGNRVGRTPDCPSKKN